MTHKILTLALVAMLAAVMLAASEYGGSRNARALADTVTPTITTTPAPTITTTPAPTNTPPVATGVTVTSQYGVLGCGGTTSVTVNVQTASGPAPDGTSVTLATSLGTLSSTSALTTGGNAFVVLTAPVSGSGTATVTATALGRSGAVSITVSCGPSQGAQLSFPTTSCGARASVTFGWTPTGGSYSQWLDLSLADNNFAPNTFISAGPLDPASSQLTWGGLLPAAAHFWRVNTYTPSGWATSATGVFVPCGGAQVRYTTYACTGGGRAAVTFYYASSSPPGFSSWLDLSLFDNGFAPGTFIGSFVANGSQQLTWTGILANLPHVWRLNTLLAGGWTPSSTGSFVAYC